MSMVPPARSMRVGAEVSIARTWRYYLCSRFLVLAARFVFRFDLAPRRLGNPATIARRTTLDRNSEPRTPNQNSERRISSFEPNLNTNRAARTEKRERYNLARAQFAPS